MYAVVSCSDCRHLWIIEERPETTTCPRCGTQRGRSKRRTFARSQRVAEVRDLRSSLLADRSEATDLDQPVFSTIESEVADGVISDDRELTAAGLDPKAVADRVAPETNAGASNTEVIERAVQTVEPATEHQILDYAVDRGLDSGTAKRLLQKLVRTGGVVQDGQEYRTV